MKFDKAIIPYKIRYCELGAIPAVSRGVNWARFSVKCDVMLKLQQRINKLKRKKKSVQRNSKKKFSLTASQDIPSHERHLLVET